MPGLTASAPAKRWSIQADLAIHSHFVREQNGPETLLLDGETWVVQATARYGLNNRSTLFATLPLIRHGAGFLDSGIDAWHNGLGLPDGKRDRRPQDRLLYEYRNASGTVFRLDRDAAGLGKAQAGISWNPLESTPNWRAAASMQLPTGSSNKLTGNEAFGVALSSEYHGQHARWPINIGGTLQWSSSSELLESQQRRWNVQTHAALGYRWRPNLTFIGQVYLHSSLYKDTDMRALDPGLSAIAGLGLRWHRANQASDTQASETEVSNRSSWEITLLEDLHTRTAPDVSLQFTYRRHY